MEDTRKAYIAEKLKQLRGTKTQKEVADAIDVTPMAISQYEQGERIPADPIKIRLAKYYGITVESLFYTQ